MPRSRCLRRRNEPRRAAPKASVEMRNRGIIAVTASGSAWLVALLAVTCFDVRGRAQTKPGYVQEEDYGYAKGYLTDAQREGRNTWYFWTGGNEKFWIKMAEVTEGHVNLLAYLDSRLHGRRFATLGAITQPGCRAATKPDQYGLWLDECEQPAVPGVPGAPAGIVGLRRFPNPNFDPAKWNVDTYRKNPGTMQPPYLIGMACGFCHIGFNPLNPPEDREAPRWANLAGAIGNQVPGRGPALQPEHAAHGLPMARRQPAAARHLGHLAVRDRSHQQSERDQFDLQPPVPADGSGNDERRFDEGSVSHPQGRR